MSDTFTPSVASSSSSRERVVLRVNPLNQSCSHPDSILNNGCRVNKGVNGGWNYCTVGGVGMVVVDTNGNCQAECRFNTKSK